MQKNELIIQGYKVNNMKKDVYNLTNSQQSIWLTEQYLKGTSIGNITGIVSIQEKVDIEKLRASIFEFVKRNDAMRTRIIIEDGTPKQYFLNNDDFKFSIHATNVLSKKDVSSLAQKIAKTPFNLIDSNLFKFEIFVFPNQQARNCNFYSSYN